MKFFLMDVSESFLGLSKAFLGIKVSPRSFRGFSKSLQGFSGKIRMVERTSGKCDGGRCCFGSCWGFQRIPGKLQEISGPFYGDLRAVQGLREFNGLMGGLGAFRCVSEGLRGIPSVFRGFRMVWEASGDFWEFHRGFKMF